MYTGKTVFVNHADHSIWTMFHGVVIAIVGILLHNRDSRLEVNKSRSDVVSHLLFQHVFWLSNSF